MDWLLERAALDNTKECVGIFILTHSQGGARGSRTLVQTGKPYAFYTLSHR